MAGIVEKYIGDAVMAVFGVPVVHEDDALRAVRAAVEMRETLTTLNDELERSWGVRLAARIGVNTGEVIAGDHSQGHLFVTGKAVNVAKRLEEAAETSEILIGEETHRLVRDAVLVDRGASRTVKHGEAVDGLSLLAVFAHRPGRFRRFDSPFVGRERQRSALQSVFENAVSDRACHLLTVLGGAGVGKSRLVQEFVDALDEEVTVLRGRCLPYGEGITYWPLAEVVKDVARAAGQDPGEQSVAIAARLAGEEKAELIAERIAAALGLGVPGGGGATEETFWAVRKLFEALARSGPLVVVFDDIHWAEPTFLDLVEHIALYSRDVPILLICIARPELLDTRRGWGGGTLNATSILLEPLSETESRQLISNLLDRAPLPSEAESRIAEAVEGNALFAEEMVAMLIDDQLLTREDDHWVVSSDLSDLPVPSSIQALLAARVEGLPADQWAIVTAASVEGTVFHRGAVSDLTPDSFEPTLELNLMDLVRRDVIRPDFADFPGDEAYRFRHALIRDAAYRSLSKSTSADLHERYAGWLERAAGERLREFEEIVGYHLEQAYRSRAAIGSIDTHVASLATRSAQRLESAGRRALARSDLPAAIGLLERASDLLALDAPRRAALLPELGAALIEAGRLDDAEAVLADARQLADFGRGRPRRLACRRPTAVLAAATGRRQEHGGSSTGGRDRDSGLRALRRRSRPVEGTTASGVAALERGAGRRSRRRLGARSGACPARRRRGGAKRHPELGRIRDVLRADPGPRRDPPLRRDSSRGERESRRGGLDDPLAGRAARDGRPLRARPGASRRRHRDFQGARPDAELVGLPSRRDRRDAGR